MAEVALVSSCVVITLEVVRFVEVEKVSGFSCMRIMDWLVMPSMFTSEVSDTSERELSLFSEEGV